MATMLEFAARHGIGPITEALPMSKVNEGRGKDSHRQTAFPAGSRK
jgi:hypothetical protein